MKSEFGHIWTKNRDHRSSGLLYLTTQKEILVGDLFQLYKIKSLRGFYKLILDLIQEFPLGILMGLV